MGFFSRKKDEFEEGLDLFTRDLLIEFNKDNHTADVVRVTDINPERVLGGDLTTGISYSVPLQDLKVFTGPRGRIFFHNAPQESILDVQRIAALEKSTVLQQITQYNVHEQNTDKIDVMKYILLGAVIIMGFVALFK